MTEHRHDDSNEDVRQAYHATAQIDERASDATRQAVLAAAARAVRAELQPVEVHSVPPQRGGNWQSFRQPFAMAATLVFAIGVGLMLFEEQQGDPGAGKQSTDTVAASSRPAVSAPVVAATNAEPAAPARSADVASAPARAAAKAMPAPASGAAQGQAQAESGARTSVANDAAMQLAKPAPARPAMMTEAQREGADAKQAAAPAATAAAPPPPPASAPSASTLPQSMRAEQKVAGVVSRERMAADLRAQDAASPPFSDRPRPAADWLALIIQLRKSGKTDEAERELRAFRLAYPQVEVPREALP